MSSNLAGGIDPHNGLARQDILGQLPLNTDTLFNVNVRVNRKVGLFLLVLCFCFFACGKQTGYLKWEDTSDNEEGFRIYRITSKDTTKIAEVGPNVTTYTDKGASGGTCYAVSAFNSAGESALSNTACLPD